MSRPLEGVKVIEFNCRWGDPEAEVLLPLLENDLLDLVEATLAGQLHRIKSGANLNGFHRVD